MASVQPNGKVLRFEQTKALDRLRELHLERERRKARVARAERVERGLKDSRWFLRYYFPHLFPCAFGDHHEQIIADFDRMLGEAGKIADRTISATIDAAAGIEEDEGGDDLLSEAEWEALLEEEDADRVPFSAAYACPREHGKSTLLVGLAIKAAVYKLRRFLLFIGDIIDQGEARLEEAKAELEQNQRLREDFGDLVGQKRWQVRDAITAHGVRMRAYGTGSKIRGAKFGAFRPDFVLVDDAENDEAVETEARRQKTRLWLTKVLMNGIDSDHGLLVVVGTILHHDSLLARLVGRDHFGGWLKRTYRALIKVGTKVRSLWPPKWPVRKLLRKKREIGSLAFASEFLNEPVSDETAPFKLEHLHACRDLGRGRMFVEDWEGVVSALGTEPLILLDCWDFGWVDSKERAESTDSNYTVGALVAVHPRTRHRHLLRLVRDRGIGPSGVKALVKANGNSVRPPAESVTWKRFRVVVESVGLQRLIYAVGMKQESDLPIASVWTDKRKRDPFEGVPRLGVLFENLQYHLPWPEGDDKESRRQRELVQAAINELWGLGREAHNDIVMALWFAEVMIGKMLAVLDRELKAAGTPWTPPVEEEAAFEKLVAEVSAEESENGEAKRKRRARTDRRRARRGRVKGAFR